MPVRVCFFGKLAETFLFLKWRGIEGSILAAIFCIAINAERLQYSVKEECICH